MRAWMLALIVCVSGCASSRSHVDVTVRIPDVTASERVEVAAKITFQ